MTIAKVEFRMGLKALHVVEWVTRGMKVHSSMTSCFTRALYAMSTILSHGNTQFNLYLSINYLARFLSFLRHDWPLHCAVNQIRSLSNVSGDICTRIIVYYFKSLRLAQFVSGSRSYLFITRGSKGWLYEKRERTVSCD